MIVTVWVVDWMTVVVTTAGLDEAALEVMETSSRATYAAPEQLMLNVAMASLSVIGALKT